MDMQVVSIHDWILRNRIKTETAVPLDFRSHLFLFEPYCDFSPDQAYKKCSQVGVTTMMITKAIYGAKHYGWNVIYTLPTDQDVSELVPSKFDKIAENNAAAIGEMNVDKVEMKRIGERFLFFKGTISKTAAIMTQGDLLVHDEKDRSAQKIVGEYQSRLSASKYRGTWALSNPSTPRFGIDLDWQRSTQKEWIIRCGKCKERQIMNWSRNVDVKNGVYVCGHCGKILTDEERRVGVWKEQNPGVPRSGYHISQLMAPWMSAKYLIKQRDENEQGDEYFFPFVLGEPYQSADVVVNRRLILDCWTNRDINTGEFYFGCDIGRLKYWVLGSEKGILAVGKTESWGMIEDILRKYEPTAVFDALPDITKVAEIVEKYPKSRMCYFSKDRLRAEPVKYGEKDESRVVWADRSRVLGDGVNELMRGDILIALDPRDDAFHEFIKHWETVRRQPKETPLGQIKYEWDTISTEDHFVFATTYYRIARGKAALATPGGIVSEQPKKTQSVIDTPDGQRLSMKEYMLTHGYHDNSE